MSSSSRISPGLPVMTAWLAARCSISQAEARRATSIRSNHPAAEHEDRGAVPIFRSPPAPSSPGVGAADRAALAIYPEKIGLAFQIADDVLDVELTPERLGKATQKDSTAGKATFIELFGLDGAKTRARPHPRRRESPRLIASARAPAVGRGGPVHRGAEELKGAVGN